MIQRLLLTLPCSDFEEICSKIWTFFYVKIVKKKLLIFSDPTDCPTTYQVRCLFENNPQISCTATFFTSEVDKVKIKKKALHSIWRIFFQRVSNLWTEYEETIELCENDGINPILALAIDDLTENVFIITQNHEPLDQVIKTVFF